MSVRLQYFILGCIIHDFAAYIMQPLHISNIKTASGSRHGFLSYKKFDLNAVLLLGSWSPANNWDQT